MVAWRSSLGEEGVLSIVSSGVAFVIALLAGAFGSVLGIGGGLFIIPSLTAFLGINLKVAIAASIVAVIATSLGGGNVYLRRHVADLRLGLLLALATAPGAIVGAVLATRVSARLLAGDFTLILAASAYRMLATARSGTHTDLSELVQGNSRTIFQLRESYIEPATGESVPYHARHVAWGVGLSVFAGLVSGLLGVGGGIIQVPVMTALMGVPIKVATSTSTYVIGITAMAGAFVYYNHRPSYVDPGLAVPVTIGVFIGASVGSRVLGRLKQETLRYAFTAVMAIYAIQMTLRTIGVGG